jgi:hypothetical protein
MGPLTFRVFVLEGLVTALRELFYRPGEEPGKPTAPRAITRGPAVLIMRSHVALMAAAAGRPKPRPCRPDLRPRACDRGEGSAELERPG